MVCWLVGGKCVKGSCPRSTLINSRQSQRHPNINLGQYKQLSYQPKPSQTPLTEVQEIRDFDFFLKSVKFLFAEAQKSVKLRDDF